jgi:tRNA nucleotidyltransferase/poly(A) polymerase
LLVVATEEQIALSIERYPLIQKVFALAADRGMPIYLVGGTVRDLMLGRDIHDLDFAVEGDGLALARYIADRLEGAYVPLDPERRTGRIVLNLGPDGFPSSRPDANSPHTLHLDVASLRGNSLAADLRGRDFTINAMAIELSPSGQWKLHDSLGGRQDLAAGVLRVASPSSLVDDPVRMLRAVRLQRQFECTIESSTRTSLYKTAPLLRRVTPERLRDEWFKILQQEGAADAVLELHQLGLLQAIAPSIVRPENSLTDDRHSPLDSLRALERLWAALQGRPLVGRPRVGSQSDARPPIPEALGALTPQIRSRYEAAICDERTFLALLKCAALLHSPPPAPDGADQGSDASRNAQAAAELGRHWRCSNREVNLLQTAALYHEYAGHLVTRPFLERRAIYRYYQKTGEYGVDTAMVTLADALAQEKGLPAPGWTRQAERAAQLLGPYLKQQMDLIDPLPLLSGHDLIETLQLVPGPQLGDLLARLREEQAAGKIRTREEALAWAQRLYA